MADPWTEANRRRDNPTPETRQKQAAKELEARRDAVSAPKPKKAPEKPYKPELPPWAPR